ncbi:hypothetical protein AGMMS49921_02300 [Endomicrobiia bacterium]|nr:hypothetical protein AGMMS49921_02300 [Endomicrobiia bacterium]
MSEMTKRGINSVHTPSLFIKYVAKTVRHGFDTTAFKNDNPKLYNKYLIDSCVKEHLKITIKGETK